MMGKRIITALLFLLPIALLAQSNFGRITHIRQVVTAINTGRTLKKVVLGEDDLSKLNDGGEEAPDGGEEVTGYFKQDTLVKIVHVIGVSTGMRTFEYYLDNNKVLFIYQREDKYPYMEKMQKLNYNVLTTISETRYYLTEGKVIKVIRKGAATDDSDETITSMKADVPKYRKLL